MRPLDLVPFEVLLDRAIEPARRHFRSLFLPVAVPLAVAGLGVGLGSVWMMRSLTELGATPEIESLGALVRWMAGAFGLLALYILFYALAYFATTVAAIDALCGRAIDMRRAWLFTLRPVNFLTLLGVSIVGLVSVLMCLLPAIYVVPILGFVLPAMADEGRSGLDAVGRSVALANFNRSRRLMSYPWIQLSVITFVGWVVLYGLNVVVQLPFIAAQQFLLLREVASGNAPALGVSVQQAWLQVPANVLGGFATVAGWLYLAFATCELFHETRRMAEGADLERAVGALEERHGGVAEVSP